MSVSPGRTVMVTPAGSTRTLIISLADPSVVTPIPSASTPIRDDQQRGSRPMTDSCRWAGRRVMLLVDWLLEHLTGQLVFGRVDDWGGQRSSSAAPRSRPQNGPFRAVFGDHKEVTTAASDATCQWP